MQYTPLEHGLAQVSITPTPECHWIRAINSTKDGLWDWNLKTNEVWYSPSFLEQLGCDGDEFPGVLESWSQRLHPEDYGSVLKTLERHLKTDAPYDVEYRLLSKKGRYHWFRARGTAYRDANGQQSYMAGSIQNIDDLKAAQQILQEKENQLRQQQILDAMGSFANGIAHQFNNLLQAISGYAMFATEGVEEDSQVYEDLQHVLTASKRAALLTSKLLVYSRPEQVKSQECTIGQLSAELTDLVWPFLPKRVRLELKLHDSEAIVYIDPQLFQQAILNLCLNARDAMMPEGGVILLRTELVTFTQLSADGHASLHPGNYVCIMITDTGCGIPEPMQHKIFEPFFTTKEIEQGVGLGLSVTRSVVHQAGGHIDACSCVNEGTTFRVYLPAIHVEKAALPTASQPAPGAKRILFIEGESLTVDIGQRILEEAGYEVLMENRGQDGLLFLQNNQQSIDLVVLATQLPDMNGLDFFERLRHLDIQVPICFTTRFDPESALCKDYQSPMCRVISQPFDEESFQAVAKELIELQGKENTLEFGKSKVVE